MASTYTPLGTYTLASANPTFNFTSISNAYTDLVIVLNGTNATTVGALLQFNNDTTANYSAISLYSTSSTGASGVDSNNSYIFTCWTGAGKTEPYTTIINIQDYASAINKTVLIRTSNVAYEVGSYVGLWRNNAAINSIKLFNYSGGNFNAGTTATLYGIKAA